MFSRRPPEPDRRSLTASEHWHVVGVDLYRVLPALPEITAPEAVLGLADGAWSRELRRFLDRHAVAVSRDVLSKLPSEFHRARFLAADLSAIRDLLELAERHAEPEIAVHLIVLQSGGSLVEWYDLPEDPIAVSLAVEESAVARFAEMAGGRYEIAAAGE
jgi:hypothetical protein